MTIKEFHINFGIELDKTQDFEYPSFQPEQIDYWLNKAQYRFIKQRAYPTDRNKPGFEENQKRIDDLRPLVRQSSTINPFLTGTTYNAFLPDDYLYLVRHRCITSDDTCGEKSVGGLQVREDQINQMLKDPFWTPTAEEPLYYINGDTLIYETKGNYQLISSDVTYIKIPSKITLGTEYTDPIPDSNTELLPEVHNEILDIAVSMVLENIESQRYQSNLNELNKTE